jgi:imidazolonepropionase-like amidohydrolase
MRKILTLSFLVYSSLLFGQDYFPENGGLKQAETQYIALTNATIYVTPVQKLNNATILFKNGKVVNVGTNVSIPQNTVVENVAGKFIYPSFIDMYTTFGIEKPKRSSGGGRSPQYQASREGFYWNDHIMPEQRAMESFKYSSKSAKEMRKEGFGVVNTHMPNGIARGTSVIVALNDGDGDAHRIIEDDAAQLFSFSKSVTSRQSYPTSLMGAMALLRQFNHDAIWYANGNSATTDRSIASFNANKNLPIIFEAGSKSNDLRADKIGDAFNKQYIIVAGGDEYETINDIKATQAAFILPLNFPEAFDVSNAYLAKYISLEDMREWNQAPTNPKVMSDNGVHFALTTHNLDKIAQFSKMLGKAFAYGYDKTKALEALTTVPASLLGKADLIGSLQNGRYANFLVTSGPLFEDGTVIHENWVQGRKNVINDKSQKDIRGEYTFTAAGKTYDLNISGDASKPKTELKIDSVSYPSKLEYSENWVSLSFTDKATKEVYRTTGVVPRDGTNFSGRLLLPNGNESTFTAVQTKNVSEDEKKDKDSPEAPEILPMTYPNVGYGNVTQPQQQDMLFKNATVWTGESAGILTETDVLVKNGKITKIGKNLAPGGAMIIDATGKHLTAGVIDEHSHIAALAINEAGHNSSAEVTIEDVVDPEDVDIYRNLAGGVTSIQILHGSANPIGGRSAIIKLKWGESANNMIYDNSPKFIKFALGENVKQSNWESYSRFPQTRMGVEQLFVNYFNRALEYQAAKKTGTYRYDQEMEVLSEILNGERFISCHSYVQSEINMLMKVAERFGFRINTFTHILEGYKLADKMLEHGVGGSTFSDWWAYKYEVNDAIPYNAAIMAKQGIVTAINSDDAEMSRRLNQEAAKTVKYGGMSEEEAWKMVTINPAKLLHIDNRVGSIKEGKDADLVLWSDHPLSVYTKAEKTIIEGKTYFDLQQDLAKRATIKQERTKLITMMLSEKDGNGGEKRLPMKKDEMHFECETINQ